MRFALVATSVAAAVAVPFAMAAAGPQMSGEEFLTAVRCTAYESVVNRDADVLAAELRLNAEARRQPIETANLAQAEAKQIALQAVNAESLSDAAMLRGARAAACGEAQLAGAAADEAV